MDSKALREEMQAAIEYASHPVYHEARRRRRDMLLALGEMKEHIVLPRWTFSLCEPDSQHFRNNNAAWAWQYATGEIAITAEPFEGDAAGIFILIRVGYNHLPYCQFRLPFELTLEESATRTAVRYLRVMADFLTTLVIETKA